MLPLTLLITITDYHKQFQSFFVYPGFVLSAVNAVVNVANNINDNNNNRNNNNNNNNNNQVIQITNLKSIYELSYSIIVIMSHWTNNVKI